MSSINFRKINHYQYVEYW